MMHGNALAVAAAFGSTKHEDPEPWSKAIGGKLFPLIPCRYFVRLYVYEITGPFWHTDQSTEILYLRLYTNLLLY